MGGNSLAGVNSTIPSRITTLEISQLEGTIESDVHWGFQLRSFQGAIPAMACFRKNREIMQIEVWFAYRVGTLPQIQVLLI